MDDQEKIAVLMASICNIGRLIPAGMTLTFSRRADAAASRMEQTFPDGDMMTYEFTGHAPVYTVPVVPAEYGLAQ